MTADRRLAELEAWISRVRTDRAGACTPASADASFRRYFRVPVATGTLIAMDAPPSQERCEPFLHVAGLLHETGLHAPDIVAADTDRGFLLLTDLGQQTYLEAIAAGDADVDTLYRAALDALVRWQTATRGDELPPYDEALLAREIDLFPEWYVRRHLGMTPDEAWLADWTEARTRLLDAALAQPRVRVHRDYIPRNLMVSTPLPGIIDFQDAVIGPITYDVASLLRDAFVSWPAAQEAAWLAHYQQAAGAAGLPIPATASALRRDLDWMAAQRHLKVLGIFARLCHRDGKPDYLRDAPRFHRYLVAETAPYEALAPLSRLLDRLPEPGAPT